MGFKRLIILCFFTVVFFVPGVSIAGLSNENDSFLMLEQDWCQQLLAETESDETEEEEEDEEPDCE
ncbi:MAG: hypothetical protein AAF353_18355 [Pseudomonadota bacterium]